jgi:acyl dehydratase
MLVWAEFVKLDVWRETMIAGKFTRIEWFAPVFAGDVLKGEAEIVNLVPRRTKGEVERHFHIFNQDGVEVLRDITVFYARKKP